MNRVAILLVGLALPAAAPMLGAQDAPASGRAAGARAVFGEVVDDRTTAPLQGATVVLSTAGAGVVAGVTAGSPFVVESRMALTDSAGRYRFDGVATGSYLLRVQRLGFRPASVEIVLRGEDSRVSIGLAVVPVRLQPLAVTGEAQEPYARRPVSVDAEGAARLAAARQRQRRYLATDVREVTHSDVAEGVTLAETDLFRALQRLPGISTRNEYSAELWTRGARWDRTRVRFDGLPLFNPLHGAGTFAAVDEDALGAAFLHPGVRPASIGEGGAGVLDLRSRAGGGAGELRGVGELSLVSARAELDRRVAGGRGAWMLAGRRTYLDLLLPRIMGDRPDAAFPYHFSELTGRLDWELTGGSALEVSALHEQDQLTGDVADVAQGNRAHWGNDIARVTLEAPFAAGPLGAAISRHTIGVSRYGARVARHEQSSSVGGFSERADFPVSADVTYLTLGSELTPSGLNGAAAPWMLGYDLTHQRADVAGAARAVYLGDVLDSTIVTRGAAITSVSLWGERRLQPAPRLTLAPGMRFTVGNALRGTGSLLVAPSISARYAPGDSALLLSFAAGRSYQYTQALAGLGTLDAAAPGVVPLWLMADADTPPLRTDLVTAGAERWLGERWQASVNAYVRRSGGVLVADPRPGPITSHALFVEGQESAQGVEAMLRRIQGRWTVALGYAYAEARLHAAGLDYAAPEDRRHSVDLTTMARVGGGLRLGAAYTVASGTPYTRVANGSVSGGTGGSAATWDPAPRTEAPSDARLPSYAALDLMLDWSGVLRGARLGLYVQLHNALGRQNFSAYQGQSYCSSFDLQQGTCLPRDHFSEGLPLIPVLGFRLVF